MTIWLTIPIVIRPVVLITTRVFQPNPKLFHEVLKSKTQLDYRQPGLNIILANEATSEAVWLRRILIDLWQKVDPTYFPWQPISNFNVQKSSFSRKIKTCWVAPQLHSWLGMTWASSGHGTIVLVPEPTHMRNNFSAHCKCSYLLPVF